MKKILEKLRQKENLTFEESKSAFELLMTGKASEDEIYNNSKADLLSSNVKFSFCLNFSKILSIYL